MQYGAMRILHLVDLYEGEPHFLASGSLRVEKAICDPLPCAVVVVDCDYEDVLGTALDVGHDRKV